jgi:hypothetical protein
MDWISHELLLICPSSDAVVAAANNDRKESHRKHDRNEGWL